MEVTITERNQLGLYFHLLRSTGKAFENLLSKLETALGGVDVQEKNRLAGLWIGQLPAPAAAGVPFDDE